MKKIGLLLVSVWLFLGCETGTRYDKNATIKELPTQSSSGLVKRTSNEDIEGLLRDRGEYELEEEIFDEDVHPIVMEEDEVLLTEDNEPQSSFSGGKIQDGLEVKSIREGKHDDYVRLVFDVYSNDKSASSVGNYTVNYMANRDDIEVVLNGYRKFSAPLPSFSLNSDIEQIYFDKYLDDSAYKFHIKLRSKAKVRVFDLKDPARLVFDIKAI
jgi:hypothetical protein